MQCPIRRLKINELIMIWMEVIIVQFQYMQIFAWRD